MRANAVQLARIVYATATVTDTQLVAPGLLPRSRPRRGRPSTPPTVEVIAVMGRLVKIRLHDIDSERRGLPFGATSANIYSFVGPKTPTDPRPYHFEARRHAPRRTSFFPTAWPAARPCGSALLGECPRADRHRQRTDELHPARRPDQRGGVIVE